MSRATQCWFSAISAPSGSACCIWGVIARTLLKSFCFALPLNEHLAPCLPRRMRQGGKLRWQNSSQQSSASLNFSRRHKQSKKREQARSQLATSPTSRPALSATFELHVPSLLHLFHCDVCIVASCDMLQSVSFLQVIYAADMLDDCHQWVCRRKKEEQTKKKDQAKILGKRGARTKLSFKLG